MLADAQNTQATGRDCTGHAELNLLREAASPVGCRDALAQCTVYASGEPCPMCAGAIYWSGVRRVVYALSIERMQGARRPRCRRADAVLPRSAARAATHPVEVLGPALEDEAGV